MHARIVAVVIASVAWAGCTGPDASDASKQDPAGEGMADTAVAAPAWSVGDWWTYDVGGAAVTWVVTADLRDAWMVDVDDPEWAFAHAAFAQISTVGRIGKVHLDGSQEAGPVRFFDFPLTLGKTWELTWDGVAFTASVVDVVGDRVTVRAEATSGQMREYVYDNATRWFRSIAAYDANGTQEFQAQLSRSGGAFAGTWARWTLHGTHHYAMAPGEVLIEEFAVPQDATDVWFAWRIECDPGGVEGDQGGGFLEAHPGDDGGYGISVRHVCPGADEGQGALEPHPPSWGLTGASAGIALEATCIPRTLTLVSLP